MKNSIQYYFMKNFGIGSYLAIKMSYSIGINPAKPAKAVPAFKKELAFDYLQKKKLLPFGEKRSIELILKNKELNTLKYYQLIGNTKAYKLKAHLPMRGQRNKTNAKTARKNAQNLLKQIVVQKKS